MLLKTISDYQQEIERVEEALAKTESKYQRRDYFKYLKRLKSELRSLALRGRNNA